MEARVINYRSPAAGLFLNLLTPLLALAGVGLLVYLITALGPDRILTQLQGLGSVLPAVLLLTGAKYPLQAAGWRLALPRDSRLPWGESISATITGDALGYLTWGGPFTGEPTRALLTRASVPVAMGIAAGAIERAMYNVTGGVLVLTVLLVHLVPARAPWVIWGVTGGLIGFGLASVARRRFHPLLTVKPRPDRTPTVRTGLLRGPVALLKAASELWRERRDVLPIIAVLCVAQHAMLVGEAYLMLNAVGAETTLHTALVFEAATKIVNTAGIAVPGRLGVAEGGSAALAGALGFAASQGLSLALMRRVRALIWGAVGLALLPLQEARNRKLR